ncbi:MAG: amino acid carrier protein [Puniceicoccales bacterium]|jgi:amino acid carrier protein|nr:amino acid carrier protein [Puniceicoccales bacterium]
MATLDAVLSYFIIFCIFPLLLGISIYFSMRLKWPQLRSLGNALHNVLVDKKRNGEMGNFAAVAAIIGGNLGAGTIAGTALAIATGGPGAIFWMIVIAFLGSIIKLACASMGVFYQEKQHHDRCIGGPMFYIEKGISSHRMSLYYCFFLIGASLTVGNLVQTHAFIYSFSDCDVVTKTICTLSLVIPIAIIFSGGLKRFVTFMSCGVPIMGIIYIIACLIGLCLLRDRLGDALMKIFCGAFSLSSMGGGSAGIILIKALHAGTSRGLFATDIGLGLAAIAHGNINGHPYPQEQHAREQGIMALLAPILVAMLCSITGILIVCAAPNLDQNASKICVDTFVIAFKTPLAGWLIPIIIYFFSFTTILAWEWFAEHVFFFVHRARWRYYYRLIFIAMIPVGAFMHTSLPWIIADICIDGLLLTNLLAIFLLRHRLLAIHNEV